MRCTECSVPVRPIVAIDIDGTLGDYHLHFWHFAQNYWNTRLNNGFDGSGKFNVTLGLTPEEYREAKLAYRQGGGKRTMPIFDDVMELTSALKKLDVEVWLTTTRPYMRHDSTDPDTRFWLKRHEISYDHLLYDDHKYRKLADLVDPRRVVMIVDDLYEQLVEARDVFGNQVPVQIDRRSNRAAQISGVKRLTMFSVAKELSLRVHKWHAANLEENTHE